MRKSLYKRKNYNWLRLFIGMVLIIFGVYYTSKYVRPTINTLADNETRIRAIETLNNAVTDELNKENIQYRNLVNLNTNRQGEVTSIVSNIVNINNMKAKLIKRISKELNDKNSNTKLSVPIGTLFGGQITSGRGPNIKFDMTTTSYVTAEIKNEFKQSGINQTLHRIMLDVNVQITSVFAGNSLSSEVNTNFCIAETVIVGNVPKSFTDVEDSQDSLAGKIFDYGGVTRD